MTATIWLVRHYWLVSMGISELVTGLNLAVAPLFSASLSGRNANFAFGPSIGFVPRENVLVRVGYNIAGFRDADFSANRSTTRGVFASMRMKLDDSTLRISRARRAATLKTAA